MNNFALLKKYLRLSGVLPWSSSCYGHVIGATLKCVFFANYLLHFLQTLWFLLFEAVTFSEFSESFYYLNGSVLMISWYAIYSFRRGNFVEIFEMLNKIITKRSEHEEAKKIYQATNEKIESKTRTAFHIMIRVFVPVFIASNFIASIFRYVSTGYSNDSFKLIYPASFPFNWKSPAGYVAGVLIQWPQALVTAVQCSYTLILILGFRSFSLDFTLDLAQNMRNFNEIVTKQKHLSTKQRFELKQRFNDIAQFHAEAMEFVKSFSGSVSGIISAFLIFVVVSLCSLLLQLNTLLKSGNYVGIPQILCPLSLVLSLLFLFCHFGNQITERFHGIGEDVYSLPWYLLPSNMQRNMPMLIALSNKEIHLRGLAGYHCTHETFKQIINTTFSYYMVLRDF